jgi:hypothetical protein
MAVELNDNGSIAFVDIRDVKTNAPVQYEDVYVSLSSNGVSGDFEVMAYDMGKEFRLMPSVITIGPGPRSGERTYLRDCIDNLAREYHTNESFGPEHRKWEHTIVRLAEIVEKRLKLRASGRQMEADNITEYTDI